MVKLKYQIEKRSKPPIFYLLYFDAKTFFSFTSSMLCISNAQYHISTLEND